MGLGVQGAEGERGLARAGQAGNDNQLVTASTAFGKARGAIANIAVAASFKSRELADAPRKILAYSRFHGKDISIDVVKEIC
jgi:hypothetical protein